jgi:hypothetical protein
MAFTDKTNSFRELVRKSEPAYRRPKTQKRPRKDDYVTAMEAASKEYLREGYNIVRTFSFQTQYFCLL